MHLLHERKTVETSSNVVHRPQRQSTSRETQRRRKSVLLSIGTISLIGHYVNAVPAASVGVRRFPVASTRIRQRELKYIFVEDEERKSRRKTSATESTPSSRIESSTTNKTSGFHSSSSGVLQDIVQAFQQAVKTSKPHQRSTTNDSNVHVGKLLMAISKMESHMRSVGMNQAANDIKSNHEKVMRLYMAAPKEKRDSVRSLLEWELETGIHGEIDTSTRGQQPIRVKNNSGAMGLFWIGHTVKYQYDVYRLMIEEGMNPVDAATIAFQNDLEPHLPWAASKMAKAMIPKATPLTQLEFFKTMGGYEGKSYGNEEHSTTTEDIKSIMGIWGDMLDHWSSPFADLQLRDI